MPQELKSWNLSGLGKTNVHLPGSCMSEDHRGCFLTGLWMLKEQEGLRVEGECVHACEPSAQEAEAGSCRL